MADELQYTFSASLVNGAYRADIPSATKKITQNVLAADSGIVSVGSGAEEDLSLTDITTNGWLYLKNLDSTNFVTWGPKSGGVMVGVGKLKAGEMAWFRLLAGVTLRWQADTAAVKVQFQLFND